MNSFKKVNSPKLVDYPKYKKKSKSVHRTFKSNPFQQRLKVFSIRGSLSSAVIPQQGSTPINRIDQTSGILYTGRLIATSETHSLFDVFTNIMTFYDWRLFLGSNGEYFFLKIYPFVYFGN